MNPQALEAYVLSDLYVKFIYEKKSETILIIIDPRGYSHRVHKGDVVGKNNGLVIFLKDNAMILDGVVKNKNLDWIEERRIFKINPEEGNLIKLQDMEIK